VALELARLGANLTLMGRDVARLDAHAEAVAQAHGVETAVVHCDVTNPALVVDAFRIARETFGAPYVLVNNAGQAEAGSLTATTLEQWNRLLAVNLTGAFLCMQQVVPAMVAARAGRIVNIASISGLKAYQHVVAYTASKHGLIGLTRAAAAETAKLGITVNAVCPAYTETDMAEITVRNLMEAGKSRDDALKMMLRVIPRGTLITPQEVAATVGWLCSSEAAAISGQAIALAGGEP
jgi:NAD(P)-dependent dehydrogenase (short-subunit alcohol dehydrogenase family)